jgi:hypothetical protein
MIRFATGGIVWVFFFLLLMTFIAKVDRRQACETGQPQFCSWGEVF